MRPTGYGCCQPFVLAGGATFAIRLRRIVVFMSSSHANPLTSRSSFAASNANLDGQISRSRDGGRCAKSIGLAIIMTIFRTRRTASVDDANLLKY